MGKPLGPSKKDRPAHPGQGPRILHTDLLHTGAAFLRMTAKIDAGAQRWLSGFSVDGKSFAPLREPCQFG